MRLSNLHSWLGNDVPNLGSTLNRLSLHLLQLCNAWKLFVVHVILKNFGSVRLQDWFESFSDSVFLRPRRVSYATIQQAAAARSPLGPR
jgi:hypothetical protein